MTTENNTNAQQAPENTSDVNNKPRTFRRYILLGSALLLIALVMLIAGIALGRTTKSKPPAAPVKSSNPVVPKKSVKKHVVKKNCCRCICIRKVNK